MDSANPLSTVQEDSATLWNRCADERDDESLIHRLRVDNETPVLCVHGDAIAMQTSDRLAWATPASIPEPHSWAFLGRDNLDRPVLAAFFAPADEHPYAAATDWVALRSSAPLLAVHEASVAVIAVSLGRWLLAEPYCSRCSVLTRVTRSGWSRQCDGCGKEHFPRTDPAVIVAVTDSTRSRLLLGSNALWAHNRYSCFAGFVEAGESLESAVEREVYEEATVELDDVRYVGSQAWPYPRSLMLGFTAVARDAEQAAPDGTEILDVRWFSREEVARALAGAGDVLLPAQGSIAARLIRSWCQEQA